MVLMSQKQKQEVSSIIFILSGLEQTSDGQEGSEVNIFK